MIRIGIRVSRIFIKSYFIISFTEEIQGYFHITGLTIVDRPNVPIVSMPTCDRYILIDRGIRYDRFVPSSRYGLNSNPGWPS